MRRTSSWTAALAVMLCGLVLVVVGCTGKTPPANAIPAQGAGPNEGADATASAPPVSDSKPLANFPDDLAGVLLISGEMVGYTEPCGCTSGQSGGLIRRQTFTELVKSERKWPMALIDLGSLINDPHGPHGGMEQTRIKFDTALKALTMLNYSAIALSPEDLKLGVTDTLMRFLNSLPDDKTAPKIVAANATPTLDDFGTRLKPSVRTAVGTVKLGVTSVLDPAAFAEIKDAEKDVYLKVVPPEDVLPGVLADLEKDTDVQILMVQGPLAMAKRLGLAYPGFDIIVSTSEFVEPKSQPETLHGGKTWLVSVGRKGQYLAAIGLPKDPLKDRIYQRITLNDRYDKFKKRGEPMRKLIHEDFVADLASADVVGTYPKRAYPWNGELTGASYVGAETCKQCHPNTYNRWLSTKHAEAYKPLIEKKREADADCVRCHTTGFEFEGGFASASLTPHLKGNQCENCHGPGSKHAEAPDDKVIRSTIVRSAEDFNKNLRCVACHDEDNAPHGFDFATMWPKVMHSKLDNYDDPKVHQGIKAKP